MASGEEVVHGVWVELPGAPPRACHRCGVVVESASEVLDAFLGTDSASVSSSGDVTKSSLSHSDTGTHPRLPQLNGDTAAAPLPIVKCPLGCGLPYCSKKCAESDRGHRLLCVGPLTDDDVACDHPLLRFR